MRRRGELSAGERSAMRSVERAQPAARVQPEHVHDVDPAPFD